MKLFLLLLLGAAILLARWWLRARGRRAGAPADGAAHAAEPSDVGRREASVLGDVRLVAMREIHERVKGRIFQVGTLVMLAIVVAAIVIPTIHRSSSVTTQTVGVLGPLSARAERAVHVAAIESGDALKVVALGTVAESTAGLRSGRLDLVIVNGDQILLNEPASDASSPADPAFVQSVATYLGVLRAYRLAGLTPGQTAVVLRAKALPVRTLEPGSKGTAKTTTSVLGLVLLFFMLTQYCSWILIGVMQEKSSRVVEVLLATLRPLQLLGGKVAGIGLVALAQATLVVATALAAGAAVGSNLLRGSVPLVIGCELLWLLLGYAFYCWVYAAAGSTAERQDQVQTLALPLSIPILIAYIYSLTVVSTGHANLLFKVLAYVPPTAPFCMPVLVALNEVTWWGFLASVAITILGTVVMARVAARIYRRAILQTGGRVRVRQLLASARS